MSRIFLDAQSTTPLLPEVKDAMQPYLMDHYGLAASAHYSGKQVRKAIEKAREQVANCLGARDVEDILFTSSGTEANNLAVKGIMLARKRFGNHVISTPLDHPSVLFSIQAMVSQSFEHSYWDVDPLGRLSSIDSLKSNLRDETILVSVPISTPELGVVQVLDEVSELLNERGVAFMVDATTAGGWVPLDVSLLKPSLMSLSPHRFHGPKGVGLLYKRRGVSLEPLMHGGNQEFGLRAGTENAASIVGAGMACELLKGDLQQRIQNANKLQSQLLKGIKERIPFSGLMGPLPGAGRICNQLHLVFEGVEGEALMLMANVKGLECHTGVSCVSRHLENNRFSKVTGLPEDLMRSSVLLSWHAGHSEADIQEALGILERCIGRLREMSPIWESIQSGRMPSRLDLLPVRF